MRIDAAVALAALAWPACPCSAASHERNATGRDAGAYCEPQPALPVHGMSLLSVKLQRASSAASLGAVPKIKIKANTKVKGKAKARGTKGQHGNDGGLKPWSKYMKSSRLACGEAAFAPKLSRCPRWCPFLSPNPVKGCHWSCVSPQDCGKDNPHYSVADRDSLLCRECVVAGCKRCAFGKDRCVECMRGYDLVGGTCRGHLRNVWRMFWFVVGSVAFLAVTWYLTVLCRAAGNAEICQLALEQRWRACLRAADAGHSWYPLMSDLRAVCPNGQAPIGGPGLMLLFNFQYAILVWTVVAVVGWLILGAVQGRDLFILGTTYASEDPEEMCQAVRWGKAVRDRMLLGKLLFVAALYVCSTVASLLFAVWQYRRAIQVDAGTSTMMDYAAMCSGFPQVSDVSVEADIKEFLQESTGCRVVGVSVCWDFAAHQEAVHALASNDVRRREMESDEKAGRSQLHYQVTIGGEYQQRWIGPVASLSARSSYTRYLFCACMPIIRAIDHAMGISFSLNAKQQLASEDADKEEAEAILADIQSSGNVFAVFSSECDRDIAVSRLKRPDAQLYKGLHAIDADAATYEPESCLWENFNVSSGQFIWRMCSGVILMHLAIVVWGVCFYSPFAYYEATTYAALGKPPSFQSECAFSMLVVVGNQIMYLICAFVAEKAGFRSKDYAQSAYVLLYTWAVIVNTIVDLGIMVYTTYVSMVVAHVRTFDGVLLKDLPDSASVFESYPMMKVFGNMLFQYNFPSCFLLPFMAEAIFTIVLPYHLGYRLVRSRPVSRQNAESCLAPIPMDLARYGDIIVNTILTTVCFFTTSGWVLMTLMGLLAGCAFVYAFDQARVLRHVENFYLSSGRIDQLCMRLLSIPCGVLAAAVLYHMRGMGVLGLQEWSIWWGMFLVFSVHVVLHYLAFKFIVPWLGFVQKPPIERPYKDVAAYVPNNWFTVNPVHCLRSKYLHRHDPPCVFFMKGKESVLPRNEALGLYHRTVSWDATKVGSRSW